MPLWTVNDEIIGLGLNLSSRELVTWSVHELHLVATFVMSRSGPSSDTDELRLSGVRQSMERVRQAYCTLVGHRGESRPADD